MAKQSLRSIRGFNDLLPEESQKWQFIEKEARSLFDIYGFSEIRLPIVEKTELFTRSIGECTDIVEKEMYTFSDRKGESLTLRPEGTASVVRAYIQHGFYNQDPIAKLYYMGPMFRYERPQKGRTRQFYQIGAEVFGVADPSLDAEVLDMLMLLFKRLEIEELDLQINSLGCDKCRPGYKEALSSYLKGNLSILCNDCQRRFTTNPLRVLDCKREECNEIVTNAPVIEAFLCSPCAEHFEGVKGSLKLLQVPFKVNPRMVRGLDYYTNTAFEILSGGLGAQNAVVAGGRYDRLVKDLGGPDVAGFGFAFGMERVALLLSKKELELTTNSPFLFLVSIGEDAYRECYKLLKELRDADIHAEMGYGGKSLKSHMRRADKLKVEYVMILGEEELARKEVTLKNMKKSTQERIKLDEALKMIKEKGRGLRVVGS
ncbi:MAG: histidine--tRNA ligase [Thermodesulfobacteriota bacterium]